MRLSKNFTLNELTKSQTAVRFGIDNTPTEEHLQNLKILVNQFLQPLRDAKGLPIRVTSCYRAPKLNKKVGSSSKSQHQKGEAVDFEITGFSNLELASWIEENMEFDQLILEFYDASTPNSGWIHSSYVGEKNRKQVLTAIRLDNGKTKYLTGLYVDPYMTG